MRLSLLLLVLACPPLVRADYAPLLVGKDTPTTKDLTVKDEKRKRDVPILVYLPASKAPAPVVLFSHGLGGARTGSAYLGKHWAARGYVTVFLQHPGSDESVWKALKPAERMAALKKAANLDNFRLRVQDVPAVLDQLEKWNLEAGHALFGRLNLKRGVGMSGHSFGAVTTQAVSGQVPPLGKGFTDSRIRAAIPMSPSTPRVGDAKKAFGGVKIPWLLMTGTKDLAPIGAVDMKSRLGVFPALPEGGNKYELVLDRAEHSAFTERTLPGDKEKRNSNHHKVILALSTAFWDAYLRGDTEAKKWLDGEGPRRLMEKGDTWKRK